MTQRRIDITVSVELARSSKEAYEPTIKKLADSIGEASIELFEAHGYNVRQAHVETLMHYVRHSFSSVLKRPRRLKMVRKHEDADSEAS